MSAELRRFAALLEDVLEQAGASLHYPRGKGWQPHVTALERIPPQRAAPTVIPAFQYLYTAEHVVLSQVQPGKRFVILDTIQLMALRVQQPQPGLIQQLLRNSRAGLPAAGD